LLTGIMIALMNQKMLFVSAAYIASLLVPFSRSRIRHATMSPWLWGMVAGTAAWWCFGATVDWHTFIRDHFYYDFRDRFLLQDVSLGLSGETWYPGVFGLWAEWARNLSPPLLLIGAAGVVWGLFRNESCRFLGVWAILGWVLASVTDWRQTKHLMLTIVPMAALGGLLVSSLANRRKRLVLGLCLAAGIYNVLRILQLLYNFDSLPPSTVW
jgi:hypothetical protein